MRLTALSAMAQRPVSDEVARAADAARGVLRSLRQVIDELSFQVARQEV